MIDLDAIKARAGALPPITFQPSKHFTHVCYPPDPTLNNGEPVVGDLVSRRVELIDFFEHAQPDMLALIAEVERLQRIEVAARAVLAPLEECAGELEVLVDHEYKDTLMYPSQQRRHERDMEPVVQARAAHDALKQALEGE